MSKIRRIVITLATSAGLIALSAQPALALVGSNHCHPVR